MFHDMFAVPIPLLEKIIRPVVVYIFLVVLLRIFGKRELAQLNPFDLVVLLSLSNTVQNAIIGEDNSVSGGVIGACSLLLINYLVVRFLFGHRRLDEIFEGKPTQLIENGKLIEKNLARELITGAELDTIARRQGFDSASELETCVLEPGGVFIMKRKEPTGDEKRHSELQARLDEIVEQIQALRSRLA